MDVKNKDVFDYEYDEDTGTVEINMLGSIYGASIEDYPEVMSRVINILQEIPDAGNVVLTESREYEYENEQIRLLREIAEATRSISSQGYLSQDVDRDRCSQLYEQHLPEVQETVFDQLRKDPVGAYVELHRKKRHMKQDQEHAYPQQKRCLRYFIQDVLNPVMETLEGCDMIQKAQDYLTGYHVGEREIYRLSRACLIRLRRTW